MINTNIYNYINVLDKAADAANTRNEIITNNIANLDTPRYKRQDLDFESVLSEELGRCKHISLDEKVKSLHMEHLNPEVYTDYANYSYRLDGNNVDIDTEQVELASEQIKYQALTQGITSEFQRMRDVIK